MRILIFLIILIPQLCYAQNKQCKKCKEVCSGCVMPVDSPRIIINNLPSDKGFVKLDSTSTVTILQNKTKEDGWDFWKFLIPLLISIAAFWLTVRNQRRDKTYKDLAFLSEVDKMMVNNPELWAIYDRGKDKYRFTDKESLEFSIEPLALGLKVKNNEVVKDISSKEEIEYSKIKDLEIDGKAKLNIEKRVQEVPLTKLEEVRRVDRLRAFCYFKLNNFEWAMERNHDKQIQEAWDNYMIHTVIHSTLFKNILKKERDDIVYSIKFRTKIGQFLSISDKVEEEITNLENELKNNNALPADKKALYETISNFLKSDEERYTNTYYNNRKIFTQFIKPIIDDERKRAKKWRFY